jgi:hypothetical protein
VVISNTYLAGTVMFVCIAQIPQRFVTVNGLSPLSAAVRLLTYGAFVPFGCALAGALMGKPRAPPCWIVLAGSVLEVIGIVLLSRINTSSNIDSTQYVFQIIPGTGTGLVNAELVILVPYAMEKRDLGELYIHTYIMFRTLTMTATGSAATSQFRNLGGLIGIAIVISVSTPYIRSHLSKIVPVEVAASLLERTDLIQQLPPDTLERVRMLFRKAYNLQVKVLIGFAAAKLPVTALMWTNQVAES